MPAIQGSVYFGPCMSTHTMVRNAVQSIQAVYRQSQTDATVILIEFSPNGKDKGGERGIESDGVVSGSLGCNIDVDDSALLCVNRGSLEAGKYSISGNRAGMRTRSSRAYSHMTFRLISSNHDLVILGKPIKVIFRQHIPCALLTATLSKTNSINGQI